MNLSQMEYFLAVAEQLNFTSAAKALYVSQPALSKQIALLEEELGTKLFIRNSRKVVLTAAGKSFEKDLKEIRVMLENAKKNAMETGKREKRNIRIGCFDGIVINDFLPIFYKHIHTIDSIMQTTLFRGSFEENRRYLEKDEIDILFTLDIEFTSSHDYQIQKIVQRKSAIIYSIDILPKDSNKIIVEDFKELPLLIPQKALSLGLYQNTLNNLKKMGIDNPVILEMENMATLRAHLEMGHGYTILNEAVVQNDSRLSKYPLPESMEAWVIAVWKKRNALVDILMDSFSV